MLFPDKKDSSKDIRIGWAVKLRNAVGAMNGRTSGTMETWISHLRRLRKSHTDEEIGQVVDWFVQHLKDDYLPKVQGAKHFCDRFLRIKELMEEREDTVTDSRSKDMADRFSNEYHFPPEILLRLPLIVEKTRENWKRFCERIQELESRYDAGTREGKFLLHILEFHAPVFVENWIVYLHRKYLRATNYSGPVSNLFFRSSSILFQESFWNRWCVEWSSSCTAFQSLLKEITDDSAS